jgi:hypothetical protein
MHFLVMLNGMLTLAPSAYLTGHGISVPQSRHAIEPVNGSRYHG